MFGIGVWFSFDLLLVIVFCGGCLVVGLGLGLLLLFCVVLLCGLEFCLVWGWVDVWFGFLVGFC